MSENQVAIVTGGAQGIGASISKILLKEGYNVVVADIQEEKSRIFVKEQEYVHGKSRVSFFLCDVTKLENYKAAFEFTLKEFKRIDVLVNNAGVICEKQPEVLLSVNVMGPINGCKTALEYMGKSKGGNGGAVINTASIAGFVTSPEFPVYCASKHAVVGLTRSYGKQHYLEKEGILFVALCPSLAKTDLVMNDMTENAAIGEFDLTTKELLDPEFVAEGVLKLLSDKINGSTLVCSVSKGFFYVGMPKEFDDTPLP